MHQAKPTDPYSSCCAAIAAALLLYGVAALLGLPQRGAALVAASEHGDSAAVADQSESSLAEPEALPPPLWTTAPFVLLLLAIAVFPLTPGLHHWWESNTNRLLVSVVLGAATLAYYALFHGVAVVGHWPAHHAVAPSGGVIDWNLVGTVIENALLQEYVPFIVLLFSLFTICGGVRIQGDMTASPWVNASFMAIGGLLASLVGTTGAAMLLIRPLLETNSERRYVAHTVVFFIFIVCNCGGCLLPIGDPPLFLGYLQGVPFLWTIELWGPWAACLGMLLMLYLIVDGAYYYQKESLIDLRFDERNLKPLRARGLLLNAPLLVGVVLAVALLDPSKPLPGTDWRPWMYLREAVQLLLVAVSLRLGDPGVRKDNFFSFSPMVEVAALFIGIFVCMQPALEILKARGATLGVESPMQFFWVTGALSSVLDNAPTYLVFLETARALGHIEGGTMVAGVDAERLTAISLGAVFLGAMTYIGNGPNFMVRAIAEQRGVRMPSFFGYLGWSVAILLPVFGLVSWFRFA